MPDSELDYAFVTGRLGIAVADGPDVGDEPDLHWCNEGTITFIPEQPVSKVAGFPGGPATLGQAKFVATLDEEGYLTHQGKRGMWLVDLTSEKVNPRITQGATHRVEFHGLVANGTPVSLPAVPVRITGEGDGTSGGGVNDLTRLMPVTTSTSSPIVRGERGTGIQALSVTEDGKLVVVLTDGREEVAGDLPVGPGGSNAGVAGYITTEGPTQAALSARIAAQLGNVADPENVAAALARTAVAEAAGPAVSAAIATDPTLGIVSKRGRWPVLEIRLNANHDPVDKENYLDGDYTITDTDTGWLQRGYLRLRGRGNSTWSRDKKPWRINLTEATQLLGMTAKQKNWALLANDYDPAKVNNAFALELGQRMSGLDWTPEYRTVELVLNGTYRGVYMLCDLVRMEAGRVPGTEPAPEAPGWDGSWLMEISIKEGPDFGPFDPGFYTSYYRVWFMFDTPEAPTAEQHQYIQTAADDVEYRLFTGDWAGWKDFADATSFADWWLINEVIRNGDSAFWSSCKIHKLRDDGGIRGKFVMGPLWDQDLSLSVGWGETTHPVGWHTRAAPWIQRMWEDAEWRLLVRERWGVLMGAMAELGGTSAWLDRTIDRLEPAITRDDKRWGRTTYTPLEADRRKKFLADRVWWMNEQIQADVNPVSAVVTETV